MKTTMTSARAAGKAAATSARKVQVLRTATTMSARRVGPAGGRAKTLKHNAGVTEMETDNGTCYGSFCYNFEFENVSRDAPNRERERREYR